MEEEQLIDILVDTILQLKGILEETKESIKYETNLIYWVYAWKAEELIDKAIKAMDGETLRRQHEDTTSSLSERKQSGLICGSE